MRLFDTAIKAHVDLQVGDQALIYVCGITPYDAAHLGHAFTFLTYDLLRRRLEDQGRAVRLVRNITDVDEPMYVKARELGVHYLELARRESNAFQSMMRALNLIDPEVEPRPSDCIEDIAASVQALLKRGVAYVLDGDVYFDVAQAPKFGQISGYPSELMRQFALLRGGDPDRAGKRQPLDFLLWHAVTDPTDPAAWHTIVGYGRPGWHIECTVMTAAHLGDTVDIHGGGTDLIFPHHECEHAQSTALGRDPFVRHWLHTAPLLLGGEKMSKSLGNLVFVRELIERADPAAVRLALMSYHYRAGGEWRDDVLQDAIELLNLIWLALEQPAGADPRPYLTRVRAALDDDLNAPDALREVRDLSESLLVGGDDPSAAAGLRQILSLLGVVPAALSRGVAS